MKKMAMFTLVFLYCGSMGAISGMLIALHEAAWIGLSFPLGLIGAAILGWGVSEWEMAS